MVETVSKLTIESLRDAIAATDPGGSLEGVSYGWADANTLAAKWWVAMPYGVIPQPNEEPPLPPLGPLQQAMIDAIDQSDPSEGCFIDLSHLGWSADSFMAPVAEKLAAFVNAAPASATPVIRFLIGDRDGTADQIMTDGLWTKLAGKVMHPNASIYYANFAPSYALSRNATATPDLATGLADSLEQLVRSLLVEPKAGLAAQMQRRHVAGAAASALSALMSADGVESYSWNHSKIFAINGRQLVTGGANYWREYAAGSSFVYDLAMTGRGDAAMVAHRYLDHVWNYVAAKAPFDQTSFARRLPFPAGPAMPVTTVPVFDVPGPAAGAVKALMVGRGGLWPLADQGVSPQAMDALRDILSNIIVEWARTEPALWPSAVKLLIELADGGPLWNELTDGLNRPYWATRRARNIAVAGATRTLCLAQQKLVMDDLVKGSNTFHAFVERLKTRLGINWNGYIWPYDLLIALSKTVATMAGSSDCGAAIRIAASLDASAAGGYEDPVTAAQFRERLTQVAQALANRGLINLPADKVPDAVGKLVGYRRIRPRRQGQHSKFVLVDDMIAYIGSDNAYPSYNLEFGFWIDDPTAIGAIATDYWQRLWAIAVPDEP